MQLQGLQRFAEAKSGDPHLDMMKQIVTKNHVRQLLSDEGRITMRWEDEPAPEPSEPSEPAPDDSGDGA